MPRAWIPPADCVGGSRDVLRAHGGTVHRIFVFCLLICMFAAKSYANAITFATPTGATTGGGPVNASATFTTSAGLLSITLTNLQANPTDVAQLLSDLQFTTSNPTILTGTLSGSSAAFINIAANG